MIPKKIEKLFKSYRDQLLHLAKLYGVVEIKSYARSAKRLTITQLELLLIKNHIKLRKFNSKCYKLLINYIKNLTKINSLGYRLC